MKKREQLIAEAKLRQDEIRRKQELIKGYTGAVRTSWAKCQKNKLIAMGYYTIDKK